LSYDSSQSALKRLYCKWDDMIETTYDCVLS